jgi:hypothetical protein
MAERRPSDAEPTGKLPIGPVLTAREVYVDDIIGGVPTVHLTPPDGPPIRFTLSADAARVLGMALITAADISRVTGWGILGDQKETELPYVDEPADPRIYAETADRAQVASLDGFTITDAVTDVREVRWLRDAVEATEPPPSKDATTPGE